MYPKISSFRTLKLFKLFFFVVIAFESLSEDTKYTDCSIAKAPSPVVWLTSSPQPLPAPALVTAFSGLLCFTVTITAAVLVMAEETCPQSRIFTV